MSSRIQKPAIVIRINIIHDYLIYKLCKIYVLYIEASRNADYIYANVDLSPEHDTFFEGPIKYWYKNMYIPRRVHFIETSTTLKQ